MSREWRKLLWLLFACLTISITLNAQSNVGSVRGTVQDTTGAVIPSVPILLTNTATGVQLKAETNEAGLYVFPSVNPGQYSLVAETTGMAKFEGNVTVQTATSSTVDISLSPAGTATTVQVADVTPVVKADTPTLSHTLERTRIEQLPTPAVASQMPLPA